MLLNQYNYHPPTPPAAIVLCLAQAAAASAPTDALFCVGAGRQEGLRPRAQLTTPPEAVTSKIYNMGTRDMIWEMMPCSLHRKREIIILPG